MDTAAYDRLGRGYSQVRRPDPRLAAQIEAALGEARSVLNVGASSATVVQAIAEDLPFGDDSFDAAMAVLTAHHWADVGAGLAEMQRVTRQRVVIVTFDPSALADLWGTLRAPAEEG